MSSLNRENIGWKVKNATGILKVNVCGPLKQNLCPHHSQICHVTNSNYALNYGSIFQNIKVLSPNSLSLEITSGSTCPKNNTSKLSSRIYFQCSIKERGPILMKTENCFIELLWETPAACPNYVMFYVSTLFPFYFCLYLMYFIPYFTLDKNVPKVLCIR